MSQIGSGGRYNTDKFNLQKQTTKLTLLKCCLTTYIGLWAHKTLPVGLSLISALVNPMKVDETNAFFVYEYPLNTYSQKFYITIFFTVWFLYSIMYKNLHIRLFSCVFFISKQLYDILIMSNIRITISALNALNTYSSNTSFFTKNTMKSFLMSINIYRHITQ